MLSGLSAVILMDLVYSACTYYKGHALTMGNPYALGCIEEGTLLLFLQIGNMVS